MESSSLVDPEFREPGGIPRSRKYTPEQVAARLARFDRIGRRCAGNRGLCVANAATFRLRVQAIDTDGNDVGEPETVQACARHRRLWTRSYHYRVLEIEHLPPQTPTMIPARHRDGYVRVHGAELET